jgi:predicted CXXCH cytochrome family protein
MRLGTAIWITVLAGLSQVQAAAGQLTPLRPADNPHWQPAGCASCHRSWPAGLTRLSPEEADGVCLECHDGTAASAEPHPIGRQARRPDIKVPADWPTAGGRLSCLTCHDVMPACRLERAATPSARRLLRTVSAPWDASRPEAFCGNCHVDQALVRLDPHRVRGSDGQPAGCNACHAPAAAPAEGGGPSVLRGSEPALCLNCHATHHDYFEPGHLGAAVSDAMRGYMAAQGARLPLAGGALIQCSTCHNPHGPGTFAAGSAQAAGELGGTGPEHLRLRGYGRELCGACHGR